MDTSAEEKTKRILIKSVTSIILALIGFFGGQFIEQKNTQNQIEKITNATGDNTFVINDVSTLADVYMQLQFEYDKLQSQNISLIDKNLEYINDLSETKNKLKDLQYMIDNMPVINYNDTSLFINGESIPLNSSSTMIRVDGSEYFSKEIIEKIVEFNQEITFKDNTIFVNQKNIDNIKSNVNSFKYLFDEEAFLLENVYLSMRNNDRETIYSSKDYWYPNSFSMVSNGVEFEKGMSITPQSDVQSAIYYKLKGEYKNLSGLIAFEEKYSDRVDKCYNIYFYCDDLYKGMVTIVKGKLPVEFNIDVLNCRMLKVVLEKPKGDNSTDPNINLIEWKLYI